MRFAKRILILTGVMLMLFGCSGEKYRLIFEESGFQSEKTAYAPGEAVEVTYDLIGTDTDYRFHSDDVDFEQDYDPKRGYIFRFTMPDHDVTLGVTSYSSMVMDPDAHPLPAGENGGLGMGASEDNSGERWFCPDCGTENYGQYCAECGLERP